MANFVFQSTHCAIACSTVLKAQSIQRNRTPACLFLNAGWLAGVALLASIPCLAATNYVPAKVKPPAPLREFRGIWVASVKNLDWPSQPGLSTAQQKAELVSILDLAKRLHLNAVLLQVRPSCDALYASSYEPWSEYLTGQMGRAPAPYYDPLSFAVEEAHRRGLELHAWFNPYRARHHTALSAIAPNHISRTRPDLTRPYGKSLWLDPSEREVQEHSLKVVMDVVRRYNIDGVHFDDYFYPYPEKDAHDRLLPFPDDASWKRYREGGGRLSRSDWRRENVNLFMMRVSQSVHAVKPWMKFGIAPFGIWRPGYPPQIKGLDSYETLYADSRKWLHEGWVDYLAPQLYWGEEKKETSFTALAQWWMGENVHHRHLWPGLDLTRVGPNRPAEEVANQIRQTRAFGGADGNLHWGLKTVAENRRGLRDVLFREVYGQPALLPAYPWLDRDAPSSPQISALSVNGDEIKLQVQPVGAEPVWQWLVQTRVGQNWASEILQGTVAATVLTVVGKPDVISICAVDRCGNVSAPSGLSRRDPGR